MHRHPPLTPQPGAARRAAMLILSSCVIVAAGCAAPSSTDRTRVPLMGYPTITGLGQVRDRQTGTTYFAPCDPCGVPTAKTPAGNGAQDAMPLPRAVAPATALVAPASPPLPAPQPISPPPMAAPQSQAQPRPPVANVFPQAAPVAPPAAAIRTTVVFASASAVVDPSAVAALQPLARAAVQSESVVYLRGGSDATGAIAGNQVLAARRAANVASVFQAAGVPAQRIKQTSCAACYVATNATPDGQRANRRVEVELVDPKAAPATR